MEGDTIQLAPPEYVIVRKLQYFREGKSQKHLRDISRMLLAMGDEWKREALEAMIQKHELHSEWQQVLALVD